MDENDTQNTIQAPQQGERKTSPMVIFGVLLGLAVIVGGFFLMSRSEPEVQTQMVDETFEASEAEGISEVVDDEPFINQEVRIVAVEAGSNYFEPNEIRVNLGDMVRIEMTVVDMMHDFVIEELGVRIPVTSAGNTATVEFTANEAGEFEYYCSVANHRQMGQTGILVVEN